GDEPLHSMRDALARIARLLADRGLPAPAAIGHRVVHGGAQLRHHCLIDEAVLRQLQAASAFAPLHVPRALALIGFAQEHFPRLPQAACFDTAFHAGLPEVARRLPIPKALQSAGVQRYGFHGFACESIVRQLGDRLPDRVVIAHLGNGASVTAVKGRRSIDTSMGLTPTGGVIMGRAAAISIPACWFISPERRSSMPRRSRSWWTTVRACWEFRCPAATCAGCVKRRRPALMRGWPSRCSAIQCAS